MLLKRFCAFIFDYVLILSSIQIPYIILLDNIINTDIWFGVSVTVGVLMTILRDVFGRSIGKVVFGLKILDCVTLEPLPAWKRVVRNVLIVIPPIDIITVVARSDNLKILDRKLGIKIISIK